MDDPYLLGSIILCLLFSALFSGMEIAFISSNKLHIEVQGRQSVSGKIISHFAGNPSRFISTLLIGNNLALVLYGILMAKVLDPLIVHFALEYFNSSSDVLVLLIQTIISTLIVLITAEFLPKSIFMINPYFLLRFFSIPFHVIYKLLYPGVLLVTVSSKFFITRVLGMEYSEDKPIFSLTDLNQYVKNIVSGSESSDEDELNTRIFHNALDFKTVKVRECMIPRTEVVAVDVNEDVEELKKALIDSGHSKIVVYDESIDNVIGYCHALEMFKKPKDIKEKLKSIDIAPETMTANDLLIRLISKRKSMALVVDEYGGTSGIVTIEDIIEEILGDIRDEHDAEEQMEIKIDEGSFMLSARLEIDYLNDKYGWGLPEGDYDTLGGLVLSVNENLPEKSEVIEIQGFRMEITAVEDTRIETIKLQIEHQKTEE